MESAIPIHTAISFGFEIQHIIYGNNTHLFNSIKIPFVHVRHKLSFVKFMFMYDISCKGVREADIL